MKSGCVKRWSTSAEGQALVPGSGRPSSPQPGAHPGGERLEAAGRC